VERARVLNRQQCNDNPVYRKRECKAWAGANQCSNDTVAGNCALSCGLCLELIGQPGYPCSYNGSCVYNICNADKGICLTDVPSQSGQPCGDAFQCWSGVCYNFLCNGGYKAIAPTKTRRF